MQPISSTGSQYEPRPVGGPGPRPAAAQGPSDKFEVAAGARSQPLLTPGMVPRKPAGPVPESPRPWPPAPTTGSAVAAMGLQLVPFALERDEWAARPTPDGWKVPRNPSRTPVQPRDLFDVEEAGEPLTVVSSVGTRVRALRLQWPEEFVDPAWAAQKAVLHELLSKTPFVLHVVAEGLGVQALQGLVAEWGYQERVHVYPFHVRSTAEVMYEPMTMWARDGSVLCRSAEGREVLLLPRSFRGDGQVDPSVNRLVVQGTGAAPAFLRGVVDVRRSTLFFEGGDVVASPRFVLVGWESVARTMASLKLDRAGAVARFEAELGRPVVVVEPQPDFHVDLGFTFLREDLVAVADPGATLLQVERMPELAPMVEITREKDVASRYDRACSRLVEAGLKVVRLPGLCGRGLVTPYFTYNNVLFDGSRVYMPVYGLPVLDDAARAVYRQHGFEVVDMASARQSTLLWGALRCATGELGVS